MDGLMEMINLTTQLRSDEEMDDVLFGKRVIKDGVDMFATDKGVWILQSSQDERSKESGETVNDHESESSPKYKSRVCWDCDFVCYIHSECEWYCTLSRSFTRGYCEIADL